MGHPGILQETKDQKRFEKETAEYEASLLEFDEEDLEDDDEEDDEDEDEDEDEEESEDDEPAPKKKKKSAPKGVANAVCLSCWP